MVSPPPGGYPPPPPGYPQQQGYPQQGYPQQGYPPPPPATRSKAIRRSRPGVRPAASSSRICRRLRRDRRAGGTASTLPGLPPGQRQPRGTPGETPATPAPPNDEVVIQPPAQKIPNQQAMFSGLDKITGRIISFDVAINETVQFGALQVTPRVCYTRPPTEAANTDAFIEVDEITLQGEIKRLFTGWMFAASPGLHAIEHPIYDIWLADCKGPQAPTVAEVDARAGAPHAAEAAAAPEAGRAADLRAAADLPPPQPAARAAAAASNCRRRRWCVRREERGPAARTRYENRKSSSFKFASVTFCGVATYSCLAPHCASILAYLSSRLRSQCDRLRRRGQLEVFPSVSQCRADHIAVNEDAIGIRDKRHRGFVDDSRLSKGFVERLR